MKKLGKTWISFFLGLTAGLGLFALVRSISQPPIERISDAIATAERVEIRFLDHEDSEFFAMSSTEWGNFSTILRDHRLTTEVQAMCHEPDVEIRFIKGWAKSLTATLSLECENFHFRDPLRRVVWVTIYDPGDPAFKLSRLTHYISKLKSHTSAGSQQAEGGKASPATS
jgi:hypothetical protein